MCLSTSFACLIFSRVDAFASEEVKEFQALSILWLECNGHKYEFTNVHVRGGDQKLHDVVVKISGNNILSILWLHELGLVEYSTSE